jgi:cyclopropane fatty-acyl-phospholipid synthase-like methyltransferase
MNYLKIAEHYKKCFEDHGDNHLGVDWPKYEDTLTRYKVMLDLINENNKVSLLDFGCGLGHLYKFILNEKKENEIVYSGLDINENFYDHCIKKYPEVNFFLKDININDEIPNFDYIVCNGTFTEKRDLSYEEMFDFMSNTLKTLWLKTNKGIAFNVMSKLVDWERDDLFHVSMDELGLFLKNNLSRNFIIRNDYKLYEYTIYVYK